MNPRDSIPHFQPQGWGRGVSVQRTPPTAVNPNDGMPRIGNTIGGRGVNTQRARAFGGGKDMTELTAPFPYAGGKSRWADIIWKEFGDVTVYAEPFAGSLAVLLRAPRVSQREIVCDKDSLLVNFWRAMQADAEAVAGAADYPSYHDDLTARHRELVRWGRENTERIQDDPRFYDAEMAGWWAWGKSLWIGGQWADISEESEGIRADGQPSDTIPHLSQMAGQGTMAQRKTLPKGDEKRPGIQNHAGGYGTQVQRDVLPKGDGKRPAIHDSASGHGVAVSRKNLPKGDGKRPWTNIANGGRGTQAQRTDLPTGDGTMPRIDASGGGIGVDVNRKELPKGDGTRPGIYHKTGGYGVQAQRKTLPKGDGTRPLVNHGQGGPTGMGVSAQRKTLPKGDGTRPHLQDRMGGNGVDVQRKTLRANGLIGDGARLLPWFLALQQRLQNVFVLNRDWSSAVTPTLLQHTPSSPKPPVGVFLDPPYRTDTGRSDALYSGDESATDVAVAAYEWAVEHGGVYRIAYAMHTADFPIPEGWHARYMSMSHAREGAEDCIIFSPACVGARQGQLL